MPDSPTLVLGTHNRRKASELLDLLAPAPWKLQLLSDFPTALTVEETGDTFAANATLKATVQARHLGVWVLGEDSGLCVDALAGAPGVYSARFAAPNASDEANNDHLLTALAKVPPAKRGANYVCHLALSDPNGNVRADSEARCHGLIRTEPVGTAGFGYDPLFEIPEYHRTFAELGEGIKAVLSHRARAVELLLPRLAALAREA